MKERIFPFIIALSALSVSASAAFYSVFGLAHLFAGASTQVIIMAGALEVAKLVVASLLYQYWDTINKILRAYFVIATFTLMVITSGGIYGYLSGAYQETATQSEFLDKQVAIIDQKRTRFIETRDDLKLTVKELTTALANPTQIQYVDKESGQLVTTTSSRQRKLLESRLNASKIDLDMVTDSISALDIRVLDAQIGNESARELGPLKYMATLTGQPMEKIVNWFMLLIIFVFDPLAIGMVVAANMAFAKLKPKNKEQYFTDRNKELERRVECSLPEGAEWDKSYPLNNHFNPNDVDKLKHWTKEQRTSSMDITSDDSATLEEQAKYTDWEEETKKEVVVKEKVIKEYIKLPKETKKWILEATKHAKRRGDRIPKNINRFFED